jgi:hypothetical protein
MGGGVGWAGFEVLIFVATPLVIHTLVMGAFTLPFRTRVRLGLPFSIQFLAEI